MSTDVIFLGYLVMINISIYTGTILSDPILKYCIKIFNEKGMHITRDEIKYGVSIGAILMGILWPITAIIAAIYLTHHLFLFIFEKKD